MNRYAEIDRAIKQLHEQWKANPHKTFGSVLVDCFGFPDTLEVRNWDENEHF